MEKEKSPERPAEEKGKISYFEQFVNSLRVELESSRTTENLEEAKGLVRKLDEAGIELNKAIQLLNESPKNFSMMDAVMALENLGYKAKALGPGKGRSELTLEIQIRKPGTDTVYSSPWTFRWPKKFDNQ